MVTFAKWAQAESAVETLQGTCSLGGQKPLVVRFADPPKGDDARGIFPKKLFVGQVRGVSASSLQVQAIQISGICPQPHRWPLCWRA